MVLSDVQNGKAIAKCFYVDKDNLYTVNQRICKLIPTTAQKIASCLSSLDEVITAHSQKLELLKDHNKGLMQNLFPQEGEKVPKYRFKEFKGEWKEELLGDIYTFKVTNSFTRDDLNYETGSVKNIHYGDIHKKFATLFDIKKEKVPFINPSVSVSKINPECYCTEGDIIFADASEDLKDVGKSIEIVNLNNEKLLSGMHTLLAKQRETKLIVGFGGHLFRSNAIRIKIQKLAQGTKVLGISSGRLSNIKIWYPEIKNEQQKIASCLSALDELIKALTEKIEQLQLHKKGLMQGLFPRLSAL
ncbi:MAG: restriction endonuclease subunit S [Chitinophagaceae bacterium]|nr:restriction endonuclease subunit S [Chitinophagaceae bacterium]